MRGSTAPRRKASCCPALRFKRSHLELKVFAGFDIKNDIASSYDPGGRLHGATVGGRVAVNLWLEPTSGLKTGLWEWPAAAGWSGDSDQRAGPYLRLGVLTRR